MFVRLSGLSFSYADSVSILSDVSFTLAPGWTGIVGANGNGKTTLLRLIAGSLEPAAGQVRLDPPTGAVRVCAQTVETLTREIEQFANSTDGLARCLHGELRLDPATLARWPTLSPGERKLWQVGSALAQEPAVLMLDEPTDHLDVEVRELLIGGLEHFRGIGIVVSHDRALLDRITSYTVRVHQGSARIWRGAYTDAKCAWEAEERERHAEYERLKHQRETLARRLADKRRMQATAAANARTSNRMKNPRDHDATSMLAKGKARAGFARQSYEAGLLRREVDRVSDKIGEYRFSKQEGRSIFVEYYVAAPVAKIFTLDENEIRAGDTTLHDDALARRCTTVEWRLENHRIEVR
ncbi:MAG: ATP-binding cassette domain-containing protein [Candidatus Binatus sp.]|uniref:ATP-binding cassette domain-containing protein n=1 Tax=Candidatus Binatus sp. TaxID=2811406 RepID=UPI002719480D|nr:ATP-binding cassette domain-containing protein [Candidatus Binatus sp.]MDO8431863.1 ATP-binding cassette domain-containing protein [Candidatus Binatus sp.]